MEDKEREARRFRIAFQMDDIGKVPPWGNPGESRLHWYSLTSGRFWIETASGNPLEYTSEIQRSWSLSCRTPDYFLARLFEDLLSILPLVLEPVPGDIAERVANPAWRTNAERWRDSDGNELGWDRWYSSTQWWHDRTVDLGYLRHAPELAFWRVGQGVFFQWSADEKDNGIPVWVLAKGQICVSAELFESAMFRFCEDLLQSMEQRVRSIRQSGWERTDCMLDVEELAKEQKARRESFNDRFQKQQKTDWRQVRASLDVLLALMGEPITNGPCEQTCPVDNCRAIPTCAHAPGPERNRSGGCKVLTLSN